MKAYKLYSFLILLLTVSNCWAQESQEAPPREAPYVEEETEFESPKTPAEKPATVEKPGVKYMSHPQAAKGLMMITKDGAYIYKTNEDKKYEQTSTLRFATMETPKITAGDGTTFGEMYSSSPRLLIFDYEWQPLSGYGKLGIQAGFGMLYASGNGRFSTTDPTVSALTPKEKYTFLAFPINLGGIYRLQWLNNQWFAPYVAGGGSYVAVAEFRDDGKSPSLLGTPGAYGSAGMLFNITSIDRDTAYIFKSEYGIANLWLSAEYRLLKTFSKDVDFSSNIFSAGISVDY